MSRRTLHLDFRRAPRSAWRRAGWLLLVPAAAAAIVVAHQYEDAALRRDQALARHDTLAARARPARTQAQADADPRTLLEVRRANAIIEQLTVPWDALFDAIEAADARSLGVLTVAPNARDRMVRMTGEARSIEDVLDYIDRMVAQPALSNVHLVNYSIATRDGLAVVAFSLAASWKAVP